MPKRFWTLARIAELKRLWCAGKSAAAIGNALGGITRSAVLGKVFRLRLIADDKPRDGDEPPARRRAAKPPPPVQAKTRRKTLFDLTNECCRWPYGELGSRRFFFCGATGADVARGIPYCPRHMARAYIVPPSLVKPLHKLLARVPKKVSSSDAAFRSFPRQRESSGGDLKRSDLSGSPPCAFARCAPAFAKPLHRADRSQVTASAGEARSADSKPAEAREAGVGGSRGRAAGG